MARNYAFTLLEILIVIIILGIIMGISVPRFKETFGGFQLKMAAHDLAQFFRYAQGESIRSQLMHKIVIENHSYWLMSQKEDGVFERISGRWGKTNKINPNIQINFQTKEIFFYPEGSIDRVEIALARGEKSFSISTRERQGYAEVVEK